MRIVNLNMRLHNFNKIISIVLSAALIILALHVSCGRETESSENSAVGEKLVSNTEENYESLAGGKAITIDLPGLPENAKKLEMVLIKPGSFVMGSPKEERGRSFNDWPPHRVTITKPFYMGKFEVTQAQWEAVMKKNPSLFHGSPDIPVEKVTWLACQKFIKRLNMLGQGTFHLPTEAEWEYCCRAGTETRFSFGDALECADEGDNYCETADKYMWWSGNNVPSGTKEVGQKLPNPWGLYDMHGNVSEWCSDRWEKPYQRGPQMDPQGPTSGSTFFFFWTNRVFRNGCYSWRGAKTCRSASRHREQSIDYSCTLGLRLVREYRK